jgi:hypothetical protein
LSGVPDENIYGLNMREGVGAGAESIV